MKKILLWTLITCMTLSLCSCSKTNDGVTSGSVSDKPGASNFNNDNAEDEASVGKKYIIGKRTITYKDGKKCEVGEDSYAIDGEKLVMTHYYKEGAGSETAEYIFGDNNLLSEEVEYNYDGSFDKLHRYEYDSNNNIIKRTEYNANDIATEWLSYTYDSAGNMTKMEKFDAFGEGRVQEINEYDSNGMKIRYSDYRFGYCQNYNIYEYNESGAILSEAIYVIKPSDSVDLTNGAPYDDNDYNFYQKKIYEYDLEGRCLGWKSVDESGNLLTGSFGNVPVVREVIEYDSQGNIKSDKYINSDNKIAGTKELFDDKILKGRGLWEYEYDDHGNMIGAYLIDDEGNRLGSASIKKAYTYDSDGKPIKCFLGADWEEWEYDKNGNEAKYTYYYSSGEIKEQRITEWIAVPEFVYDFVNSDTHQRYIRNGIYTPIL